MRAALPSSALLAQRPDVLRDICFGLLLEKRIFSTTPATPSLARSRHRSSKLKTYDDGIGLSSLDGPYHGCPINHNVAHRTSKRKLSAGSTARPTGLLDISLATPWLDKA